MPMIDIYASAGTFSDPKAVAQRAAEIVKTVEQVPDIPMFRENTAGFVHEVVLSDVDGSSEHVRVQVLTNAGALDRDKQLAVVEQLTQLIVENGGAAEKTWVLLTEAVPGGWGLWGHAHTNDEIVAEARKRLGA